MKNAPPLVGFNHHLHDVLVMHQENDILRKHGCRVGGEYLVVEIKGAIIQLALEGRTVTVADPGALEALRPVESALRMDHVQAMPKVSADILTVVPDEELFVAATAFSMWSVNALFEREFLRLTERTGGKRLRVELLPMEDRPHDLKAEALPLWAFAAVAKTGRSFICCMEREAVPLMALCYQSGPIRQLQAYPREQLRQPHDGYQFARRVS